MNYTRILFAALLLPVSGYGNTERIKQLKEEQLKKSLELKELAKQIGDADNYISSCREAFRELLLIALDKKLDSLGAGPHDEEKIMQELEDEGLILMDDLKKALRGEKPLVRKFMQELFNPEDITRIDAFESLKFMYVRALTERNLITLLVDRYEKCFMELVVINQQLLALEQYGN